MPDDIAVIGLGSMGSGVAGSLLRAGYTVYGFDVNPASVATFVANGGAEGEIRQVAPSLQAVVVVVLNASQTESVLFGEQGVVPHLASGAVVLGCSTVPPEFAREMAARCLVHGVHYLDAPISGGSVKAAAGALSVMASGPKQAFDVARPVLDAMAERVFELGAEPGTGSAMKSVNQLLAGVHIASMAEAMTFGMTQGIEPGQLVDVISKCAGTSWMFENRAPHVVAGDYTPHSSINIWLKDLGIVREIAGAAGFQTPLTETALAQFAAAAEAGLGNQDDAAVAKVYARNANLKLPGE